MLKKLTAAVLAALSLATVTITPTTANAWPWRPGWGYWHPGWRYWHPGWGWGWRAYWAPGWAYYPGCRSYWRWAPYQGRWVRAVTCY